MGQNFKVREDMRRLVEQGLELTCHDIHGRKDYLPI
jgi:hypothetical protein